MVTTKKGAKVMSSKAKFCSSGKGVFSMNKGKSKVMRKNGRGR